MKASKVSRLSEKYESKEIMSMKYKEIISTLPKREPPHPLYEYYQYQGFWCPLPVLEASLSMQHNFKAQPYDIYLCSSPKTGTTWLKSLAFSIMTRDRYSSKNNPLLTKLSHDCLPFLELDYVSNPKFLDTELPLLSTHLPYTLLPKSILESDCKIIYICREPKDRFVSMWHFSQNFISNNSDQTIRPAVTLEQEFEWFCQGKSGLGPYWDHVLGYWKASIDRPHRVFFFKYEDLKKDTLYYVKKLAEFMEKPFSMEEEAQGVPEEIVDRCHFKSLSNLEVNKSGKHYRFMPGINNSAYFRKGEIGDWNNLLTEDMANAIDQITQEKFQSLGLTFSSSIQCD
ncbi:flavonol sulfotransferase-like [Lycium ferocissimum]|uniref:flavonol sulfotransferase-like n=1 Tax=Lycium ferocissimum TaxID=112874 RepID=UPI0028160D7B|nr:flavonol sulfotransferase-like [Lycium ferocissimum]